MDELSGLYERIAKLDLNVSPDDREPVQYRDTAIFKSGKKIFVFVAVTHRSNDSIATSMLDKLFEAIKPVKLLLETPNDLKKEQLTANIKSADKKYWNEFDYAISLALQQNIEFCGVDTSEEDKMNFFMNRVEKDGFKLFLLEYLSVIYNSIFRTYYSNSKGFSDNDYYEVAIGQLLVDIIRKEFLKNEFVKTREKDYKSLSLSDSLNRMIAESAKEYVGKDLDKELLLNRSITAPFPYCKEFKVNEINTWHEAYRDHMMIDAFMKMLEGNDRVIMVGGSGHAFVTRDVVAEEMKKRYGSCEVLKWKEFMDGKLEV